MMDCPKCGGDGTWPDSLERCPLCYGFGTVPPNTIACEGCKGAGVIKSVLPAGPERPELYKHRLTVCTGCHGIGYIQGKATA